MKGRSKSFKTLESMKEYFQHYTLNSQEWGWDILDYGMIVGYAKFNGETYFAEWYSY